MSKMQKIYLNYTEKLNIIKKKVEKWKDLNAVNIDREW